MGKGGYKVMVENDHVDTGLKSGWGVIGKRSHSVMARMVMVRAHVARGWGVMLWVRGGHGVHDGYTNSTCGKVCKMTALPTSNSAF